jgi:hypothetical protein
LDAIKKGNAVFGFTLKNQKGETDSWYIDLKNTGDVARGEAPAGKQADGEPPNQLTGSDPRKRPPATHTMVNRSSRAKIG